MKYIHIFRPTNLKYTGAKMKLEPQVMKRNL